MNNHQKRALYESIMKAVSKQVIRTLHENHMNYVLMEKFNSSVIQTLYDNAMQISKENPDTTLNVMVITADGSAWMVMTMSNGRKIDATHTNIKDNSIPGMTIGVVKNSNFLGEIDDDDIYQKKFMNKEEFNKFTNGANVSGIKAICKSNKAYTIIIVSSDYKTIYGGALLQGSVCKKFAEFVNKQKNRQSQTGSTANGEQEKTAKAFQETVVQYQKQFMKNHAQDDVMKITKFVNSIAKNGYLKADQNNYLTFTPNDNNEVKAMKMAKLNIMGYLFSYGSTDNKDNFKNNKQLPQGIQQSDLIKNNKANLLQWYDKNIKESSGTLDDDQKNAAYESHAYHKNMKNYNWLR